MKILYRKAYIYKLQDPSMVSKSYYIGQTRNTIKERLRGHIKEAKRKRIKDTQQRHRNWLRSLLNRNIIPEVIVLEEFDFVTQEEIDAAEKWYIKFFKHMGITLTNGTDGGIASYPIPEVISKISNTLKLKYASGELSNPQKGKHLSDYSKLAISKAHLGKKHTMERRLASSKQRMGRIGKKHTEETKAKLRLINPGSARVNAKLTEAEVDKIKSYLFENKLMIKEIAILCNINSTVISKMIAGKKWKHCFSDEERYKLRELQKNKKQVRMAGKNNHMYGKKCTEETKSKISNFFKGRLVGTKNPMAKLNENIVRAIKVDLADGELSQRQIAKKFNIGQSTISDINSGNRWKNIIIQ